METEKNTDELNLKYKLIYAAMFILSGAAVFGISLFLGRSYEVILRNTITALIISGLDIFVLTDALSRGKSAFFYDNYERKNRFVIIYLISLILSVSFPFISNELWTYMVLFIMLSLLSNAEIGLVSGTGFVIISCLLAEVSGTGELLMYVLAGAFAIAAFRDLREDTIIGFPIAISLIVQAVLLTAFEILFKNRALSLSIFYLPVLNLMIDLLILAVFLNMYAVYIIRRSSERFMVLNDPGYKLLAELKEKDKDEYFKAVHTAYLAERVAGELSMDARLLKNCVYYHNIGKLENKANWLDVESIYTDNGFPYEAIEFIKDYTDPKKKKIRSREAVALQLCEETICEIMGLIKNDKNAKINYEQLIDKNFDNKLHNGEMKYFDITFREYESIRRILKKEKLYYDFLR